MESHPFQKTFSYCIVFLLLPFCMISAINFYDKTFSLRDKINNIISNDILTVKTCSDIQRMQMFPQYRFCECGIFPVFLCILF